VVCRLYQPNAPLCVYEILCVFHSSLAEFRHLARTKATTVEPSSPSQPAPAPAFNALALASRHRPRLAQGQLPRAEVCDDSLHQVPNSVWPSPMRLPQPVAHKLLSTPPVLPVQLFSEIAADPLRISPEELVRWLDVQREWRGRSQITLRSPFCCHRQAKSLLYTLRHAIPHPLAHPNLTLITPISP
jgi:hypothetical protein